ncbi:methyltransferase domain-containing protein [Pseudonocardia endophytica]|uniref:Methyltransferase family protein n=1 Tax=Pseudonocardia endophytica TaxID=401976 RepID=A0A4R1HKU0_PSEEN|nr:methyltransferase domain-containing protein [Pseudonocardia endophytica]TCK21125.1 methyltransferase family protein [Pseudonocardia endophytica]
MTDPHAAPISTACPACATPANEPFIALTGLPVHGTAVFDTPEAARRVTVGDQELCLCPACGVVFNRAFDPALLDYTGSHEESQHNSPRFAAYAAELSADWTARYRLTGTHVVEIGCGAGDFAVEMLRAGVGGVTGIDPHFAADRVPADLTGRLTALPSEFDARQIEPGTSAVVCRHTLEHIPALRSFGDEIVTGMRKAAVPAFLAEVPDLGRILAEGAFWDLQYEHCSYFTPETVTGYLRGIGFGEVAARTTYDDQYVVAEATAPDAGPDGSAAVPAGTLSDLDGACRAFADTVRDGVRSWGAWMGERSAAGDPVAVWGGGAKGLTFLAMLGADAAPVRAVVDINPGLQGRYIAGPGLPIVAPADLTRTPPRSVVLMNPIYRGEVRADLDRLGLQSTELLAL